VKALAREMSSSTLASFDKLALLGRGSYGSVYKVRRVKDNKEYVMKQISLEALSSDERKDAIEECKIMARLKHPHVVKYYDSFIDPRTTVNIVMEFCPSGDLQQLLAKEAAVKGGNYLHEESIWKYLLEIATGMYYMHSKHVLHRDVKTVRMIASFCASPTSHGLTPNIDLRTGKHLHWQTWPVKDW
jgi:NIMA (never in mitosis gene a)-related kinase